jgi:hypothetical protein
VLPRADPADPRLSRPDIGSVPPVGGCIFLSPFSTCLCSAGLVLAREGLGLGYHCRGFGVRMAVASCGLRVVLRVPFPCWRLCCFDSPSSHFSTQYKLDTCKHTTMNLAHACTHSKVRGDFRLAGQPSMQLLNELTDAKAGKAHAEALEATASLSQAESPPPLAKATQQNPRTTQARTSWGQEHAPPAH